MVALALASLLPGEATPDEKLMSPLREHCLQVTSTRQLLDSPSASKNALGHKALVCKSNQTNTTHAKSSIPASPDGLERARQ